MLSVLGIKISFDDFLDFSYFALNSVRPFCFSSKFSCLVDQNGCCDLPVYMKYIKAVSTMENTYEQWRTVQTLGTEDAVRVTDVFAHTRQDLSHPGDRVLGEYADFELVDPYTVMVSPALAGRIVYIVGLAPLLDQDSLPLLTARQVEALAYQVAVLYAQKQMFMGCLTLDLAYLTRMASKKTAQARVPDFVTDNEWDEILNIRSSFDRKVFNHDFKFKK